MLSKFVPLGERVVTLVSLTNASNKVTLTTLLTLLLFFCIFPIPKSHILPEYLCTFPTNKHGISMS